MLHGYASVSRQTVDWRDLDRDMIAAITRLRGGRAEADTAATSTASLNGTALVFAAYAPGIAVRNQDEKEKT